MRLPSVLVALLVSASASAQYFDDGWRPGQPPPAPTQPSFQPNPNHQAQTPPEPEPTRSLPSLSDLSSLFSLETLLDSKPSRDLFNAFGINITDRIANASKSLAPWDDRVPLVTDDNFQSMIVDEDMPADEESKRVWFLIVTVSSTGTNSISQFADKQFDEAFDTTLQADDLPHVRWGRIDYMNVTRITTKWGIWSAPVLVVLTDRGQTLRFYRATQIRLRPDALREFLRAELWQHTPPWSSAFAPGGKREFVMDWLAYALEKNYDVMRTVPRWLLYVLTGMIGSLVINLLHRSEPAKAAAATDKGGKRKKVKEVPAPAAPAPVETATATATDASSSGAVKGRGSAPSTPSRGKKKGGKK